MADDEDHKATANGLVYAKVKGLGGKPGTS